jgi:carboxymethylenebutenolidase
MTSGKAEAEAAMVHLWEAHMAAEFATKDVDATTATMVEGAHVNHVPTMTGGTGLAVVRDFYTRFFIPQMPADTTTELVSRTVGTSQVVDELVFKFTHTCKMDWILPGVAPTGKRVEVGLVVIVGVRDGMVSIEHIYWDQASVLVQVGLLDPATLPVAGVESAHKVLNPDLPSNTLIHRADRPYRPCMYNPYIAYWAACVCKCKSAHARVHIQVHRSCNDAHSSYSWYAGYMHPVPARRCPTYALCVGGPYVPR